MNKQRIDVLLVELGLAESRTRAQALLMAGSVLVDERPVTKPGTLVDPASELRLRDLPLPFVSRGGLKLEQALEHFGIDVAGRQVIDVGASTGGFTDCVLQRGARAVIAVDVGYGQLAHKLRTDPRVHCLERTNIRELRPEMLPFVPDCAVADLSFISLEKVLAPLSLLLARPADVVLLVKPQFEVGKGKVGKGGVVRDPKLRAEAIARTLAFAAELGFERLNGVDCATAGPAGNVEYLAWLRWP